MSVVNVPLVKGSTTITFTGVGVATETISIGDKVYTMRAVPAAEAYAVDIKADETTQAAGFVNAINVDGTVADYGTATVAHPDVVATSALGVVTLTARVAGIQINGLYMAETGTNVTAFDTGLFSTSSTANSVAGSGLIPSFVAAALTGLVDPKAKTISLLKELI